DSFGAHRAQLIAGYQSFLDRAVGAQKDREIGQASLFDLGPSEINNVELPDVKPWTRSAMLAFEKEVLGFFLSDHPLKGFENLMKMWTTSTVEELPSLAPPPSATPPPAPTPGRRGHGGPKRRVIVAGLMVELKEFITKKGTRMAFGRIEDLTGSCELVIFPDTFAKYEAACREEKPILVAGQLEVEEGNAKIMVDSVVPFEEMMKKAKKMVFHLDKIDVEDFPKLKSLVGENPGPTGIAFEIQLEDLGRRVQMEPPQGVTGVQLSNDFLENIHAMFGRTDFIELRAQS
ncbi:MAG TPA: DNA polymerase III subunit alpha, partial [Pseudobdellovibrionaceae bacterium]|nr:DNA polymerase III subunit alpha [Pseudobdellovibrionaceae bacterium]